ncbi:ATP-binding cassette domain-containing protein [Saprospiraceae bacterium]|nr:ATP-binding cassette domain-containing protein [Saprospiraceae bacterium]
MNKFYGQKQILKDINLSFEGGKVYGIVGENGAGKTTLFRCIAGLEDYAGTVKSEITPLKDHLGLLWTEPYFFDKITAWEYIQLLTIARHKKNVVIDEKNIFDLPLQQYASTYSTGMKKKLALTAILLQENDYFILDEPFNGVDIQSNIIITEIIHQLKKLGKTIIISSHIFSTLADTCDEIHLLQEGVFVRKVAKTAFKALEEEMKQFTVGDKVAKLGLK